MDEATQPSTQPYNDPRRIGRNNSGMSDHDLLDVICILHPMNTLALDVVRNMMITKPQHVLQNDDILDGFDPDDLQMNLIMQSPGFERDLALRMSSEVKNPEMGFTFGRNRDRCDIVLADESEKNISNIHFGISLNENGILMLEDRSTNGTAVDGDFYRKIAGPTSATTMLQPNSTISIFTRRRVRKVQETIEFMVRYPSRGEYAQEYNNRLREYIIQLHGMDSTIAPTVSTYDTHFGMYWDGGSNYNVVGNLGKGAFAVVYKIATKRDGRVYAAKEVDKRRFMKNGVLDLKVENEMKIMSLLRHPNIVQYEDYFDYSHWIYIIMEFVPGGELSAYLSRRGAIPEPVGQDITRQILHALDYLHKRGITHRDIKPDNILISNYQPLTVKLSDFGLSKCIQDQETFLKTFCGTLLYCAPEVYPDYANYRTNLPVKRRRGDGRSKTSPYSQAVDIWSFGAVLYHILCNKPPIMVRGDDRGAVMLNNIMTHDVDYTPLRLLNISERAISFISGLLNRDPAMRPTEAMCFQHEWIVDVPDRFDYSQVNDDLPPDYQLNAIEEIEEDAWDGNGELQLYDNGKENIIPTESDELRPVEDRVDPRFQSKRQRLRGGGDPTDEDVNTPSGGVKYPVLPTSDSSPMTSPSKGAPRLFGEISQSALQSSGIFSRAVDDHFDIPALRKNVEKISVNDFFPASDKVISSSEASTKVEERTANPNTVAPIRQGGISSLYGAESDLRDLNMYSPEGYQSDGATPDTGDTTTPQTREVTPAQTEPFPNMLLNEMAPPPVPGDLRRKSANQLDSPPSLHDQNTTIPHTVANHYTDAQGHDRQNNQADKSEGARSSGKEAEAGSSTFSAKVGLLVDNARANENTPPAAATDPQQLTFSTISAFNGAPSMPKRLGRIFTTPGSIISAEIPLTSLRMIYGRGMDSTHKFPDVKDIRIPKYGLKLAFHSNEISNLVEYLSSGQPFSLIHDLYVSITTSATRGIYINDVHLPHQDSLAGGYYWGKVQTGDVVTLYDGENVEGNQEYLKFEIEINYGDSAKMRREGDEPFCVHWTQKRKGAHTEFQGTTSTSTPGAAGSPGTTIGRD